jgi:hypothetical protein
MNELHEPLNQVNTMHMLPNVRLTILISPISLPNIIPVSEMERPKTKDGRFQGRWMLTNSLSIKIDIHPTQIQKSTTTKHKQMLDWRMGSPEMGIIIP